MFDLPRSWIHELRDTDEPERVSQQIALTTLVVKEYDEAIEFYVDKLGFSLSEDTLLLSDEAGQAAKRWVTISPEGSNAQLLLARASSAEELASVGNQAGGRVFLFLHTDDFWRDHKTYTARGVEFVRGEPREEVYGTVAVFKDLYGNLWDLIERA